MSIVNKSVPVEQAPLDLLEQLGKIVKVVKAQSAPLSAGALPVEIGEVIADLQPILADCQGMGAAYGESKVAFFKALVVGGDELAESVLGVAPAAAPASS